MLSLLTLLESYFGKMTKIPPRGIRAARPKHSNPALTSTSKRSMRRRVVFRWSANWRLRAAAYRRRP